MTDPATQNSTPPKPHVGAETPTKWAGFGLTHTPFSLSTVILRVSGVRSKAAYALSRARPRARDSQGRGARSRFHSLDYLYHPPRISTITLWGPAFVPLTCLEFTCLVCCFRVPRRVALRGVGRETLTRRCSLAAHVAHPRQPHRCQCATRTTALSWHGKRRPKKPQRMRRHALRQRLRRIL